jgi:hypothetical protein
MTITESRRADRKKLRFPPPKTRDPEAMWTQECVMFRTCGKKHSPAKCDAFKKLSPQQRLKEIDSWELCRLCYVTCKREGNECFTAGGFPSNPILFVSVPNR